jgi:hypothetical protein
MQHTETVGNAGPGKTGVMNTPMLDRAMHQSGQKGLKTWFHADFPKEDGFSEQPDSLLRTIERSLKDIYEWACENQKENQGLLYDLNTAIAAVERCGVKIKDGR